MKKYMLLHFGFDTPTPEIMEACNTWFESVADRTIEHGGFMGGKEITHEGIDELPWGMESITGYSIINAESMDEAVEPAQGNPAWVSCHPSMRRFQVPGLVSGGCHSFPAATDQCTGKAGCVRC